MRRWIGLTIAALLLTNTFAQAQKPADKQADNFTFLCITDTHQSASGSNDALRAFTDEATKISPRPAFIIDTGDITEAGRPEEYARFKEATTGLDAAGIKFYAVPGNHDVRWSPDGKEGFLKAFGLKTPYQSFDYGGIHFVLLDSTVLLEHWGHFDKAQLDWLSRDIKRLKPDAPIMLFMHHWIGRDLPSVRPIDNEYDLWPILRGHNVLAIFTGHGHQDLQWKTNGITTLMARGLYQGSYHRVNASPLLVNIDRIVKEKPNAPIHLVTIPVERKTKPSNLRVGWNDPDVPFLERRRPIVGLEPRAVTDNPEKESAEYRIDDGAFKKMTRDARDIWSDVFPTKNIPIGIHSTDIQLTTSNGITYSDELIFEVERDDREPTRRWAVNLDGPIQSSPVLFGDRLIVSSLDGKVTALETQKGKRKWAFTAKGPFLSSPVVDGETVYIGCADHNVYAIDANSGRQKWKFDTGSPVFASAAVAQGVVCIGGNGKIYGLDASKGTPVWTQNAGGFFQARAVTDGNAFYLGGWDNTFYALDARTGTPKWTAQMGRSNGGKGTLQFYYAPAIASPALGNGRVYVCSNDGVLHALNAESGHEDWTASAPQGGDPFGYSSPVTQGLKLYIGGLGDHGDVYALDAATGHVLWQKPTGQTIYDSSPKLSPDGNSLAIMAVRGRVSVLNTTNGDNLWRYELGPGNIFSTPEYDGKTVYTVTMANDVQALNAPKK